MAQRTRKSGSKTLGKRPPPPAGGSRKPEAASQSSARPAAPGRKPKAESRKPAATAETPKPATDWPELADRAAKKFAALIDQARPWVGKAGPAAGRATEAGRKMAVDLSGGVEEAFGKVSEQAKDLAAKGQHTRVKIRFRGREIAELPIAVVAAAEVASLWWFGPLRLLLGHVVGKAVLEVEFVSNADHHVAVGRGFLADGELERALAEFDRALAMDRRCPGAHLGRGIALKLRRDIPAAREAFERAEEYDPRGEAGREARRHRDNLG